MIVIEGMERNRIRIGYDIHRKDLRNPKKSLLPVHHLDPGFELLDVVT